MIQIIAGEKGKGKTKHLIKMANDAVKKVKGNIVYLDKSHKHTYEIDNRIRIINVKEFPLEGYREFFGFLCGIISQDYDINEMYLDSFLNLGNLSLDESQIVINKLEDISKKYDVRFIISMSCNLENLPENVKPLVALAL